MEISIEQLLSGKATMIKSKEYYSTEQYVMPFIDKMNAFTNDFRVKVKLPDQITLAAKEQDLTYNRVLIEAVLPANLSVNNDHNEVIGFVYGLDVRKPIAKIYRGYLNQACTNLCVFNPQWVKVQEIKSGEDLTYDIKELMSNASDFDTRLTTLRNTFLDRSELYERLGEWVDGCLRNMHYNGVHSVKLSPSVAVDAYTSLFLDNTSKYYKDETEEASMFDVYNAFTQVLTDDKKDIMNKFEKTLLVNQLLHL